MQRTEQQETDLAKKKNNRKTRKAKSRCTRTLWSLKGKCLVFPVGFTFVSEMGWFLLAQKRKQLIFGLNRFFDVKVTGLSKTRPRRSAYPL